MSNQHDGFTKWAKSVADSHRKKDQFINRDDLMKRLGIHDDCFDCDYSNNGFCTRGSEFCNACEEITSATIYERGELCEV